MILTDPTDPKAALVDERALMVKLCSRNKRKYYSMFTKWRAKAQALKSYRAGQHRINVIDWEINRLEGRELTRPMPQPLGYEGGP